ncbi:hypothetical protein AKO1_015697 [Acrasis kona]|uniref:C2 domain-containing protein n=1 Tax=Acrasis kona TaxID=1008807 RepID=A0AAW2ZIQ5_9EUKA
MRDVISQPWIEIGRTEVVKNNLNPKWAKSFIIDYFFERNQYIKLLVMDIDDSSTTNIDKQETLGVLECSLANIITSCGSFKQSLIHPKHPNEKRGFITAISEQVTNVNAIVHFDARATHLDRKDIFGSSDPFLVISKSTESGIWQPVHKTEVHKNTLNVSFAPFQITLQHLCNGDNFRTLRIECFDWNKSGSAELIGAIETSLDTMLKQSGQLVPLISKKSKKAGELQLQLKYERCYSFLDYISSGYQISTSISIDFTGSNGDPKLSNSLHYRSGIPGQLNQYQSAIWCIGSILDHYDSDHTYPCFGFGAKLPNNQVSHCFPLSLDPLRVQVQTIQGVLFTYDQCLNSVALYGPTNFSQIINQTAAYARSNINSYHIMLIITDGVISDKNETIREIVDASVLPLSIIIVGVGNADFADMNVLDADVEPLKYGNNRAARDIVQFVSFRDFAGRDPSALASHVLAEIPQQFTSYMRMKGIVPVNRPGY